MQLIIFDFNLCYKYFRSLSFVDFLLRRCSAAIFFMVTMWFQRFLKKIKFFDDVFIFHVFIK